MPADGSRRAGVLFDLDGTLLDTNYLHVVAWGRAFAEMGESVSMSAIHRLVGMGSDRLVPELLGRDDDRARDGHRRHYESFAGDVHAFPMARELLEEVARRGAAVILASSCNEDELALMRSKLDVDEVISHAVCGKDAGESKPAPDIFAIALETAGLSPDDAVAVGDTVWDVEAARRLGLRCVGVLSGGFHRRDLEAAGAVAVYEDVAELLREIDRSPLGALSRRT